MSSSTKINAAYAADTAPKIWRSCATSRSIYSSKTTQPKPASKPNGSRPAGITNIWLTCWQTDSYNAIALERGLELSEEKTNIRHLKEGFDFLGFNIRVYAGRKTHKDKLLIKPSKASVQAFKDRMKQEWHELRGQNVHAVMQRLNPILRGWGQYFRNVVSMETFKRLDTYNYEKGLKWLRFTHPGKPMKWIKSNYFGSLKMGSQDKWVMGDLETGYHLTKLSWLTVKRHAPILHGASPDNPELRDYWERRNFKQVNSLSQTRQKRLAKKQKGICPVCRDTLFNGEKLHIHHKLPKAEGGTDQYRNLALLHVNCHQQVHRKREVMQFA